MSESPRIKDPWIAIAVLEFKLRNALNTEQDEIALSLDLALEILSFYEQAKRAARFVAVMPIFKADAREHTC